MEARVSRRQMNATLAAGLLLAGTSRSQLLAAAVERKFTIDLCPGRIGVRGGQQQIIDLAAKHGFESVEPFASYLAEISADELAGVVEHLQAKKLVWGAAGLPVEFRKDQAQFETDLKRLPRIAAALQAAGVRRIGTWLMPSHDQLTYMANFQQHTQRLSAVANVLNDHGLIFGLEYVGPHTSWTSKRFAFIHTLEETLELIASIDAQNVGLILDSWHWYTAEETLDDLKSVTAEQIVAVDLNDAPSGVPVQQQIDGRRELPAATGVIDVEAFLRYLVDIGYDGPVRAEPFNQKLNEMDDEAAVAATSKAMQRAVATLQ